MKPEWASLREDPNTIDLSGDSTDVVLLYVRWLYSEEVQVEISKLDLDHEARCSAAEKAYIALSSAYVFGEKILDTKFKNAVLLKIHKTNEVFEWSPGPIPAAIVYEGTTEGSPLRRLFADMIVCDASDDPSWAAYFKDYPRELLVDALTAMSAVRYRVDYRGHLKRNYLEKEESQVNSP